jgi:DNA repair protein RadC
MRRTTPDRKSRKPKPQVPCLAFVGPGEAVFQAETIARYRVALVREESTPYDAPEDCSRPPTAARFIQQLLSSWDREVVGAIYLDNRNRAIGHQLAYIGTLTRSAVEPRGILVAALLANAASFIVFHNHPSGNPSPSSEDIVFTRRLAQAADIVGVRLLDHIIVGEPPQYVSLHQRGVVSGTPFCRGGDHLL